jgi:hypothetical protein
MENTPPRTFDPAELFEFLIGALCGVIELVGARHGLSDAVMGRIWRRVRRLGDRFARLVEQVRAGGFCDAMMRRSRAASERPAEPEVVRWKRLPGVIRRYVGWLVSLLRETDGSKDRMYWILARPEVKALLAEAPLHFGQILRPLCRMLGVEVPIPLLLAAREHKAAVLAEAELEAVSAEAVAVPAPRPRRIRKYPPAPEELATIPDAIHRPDGSIWLHLGASCTWRPSDGGTLERARKHDPPRRIWPREE